MIIRKIKPESTKVVVKTEKGLRILDSKNCEASQILCSLKDLHKVYDSSLASMPYTIGNINDESNLFLALGAPSDEDMQSLLSFVEKDRNEGDKVMINITTDEVNDPSIEINGFHISVKNS